MAIIYVRSTDGNNADNGSTWALAKATAVGAGTACTAGDTIYLSQAHAETTAGNLTITLKGTFSATTKLICANDGAEPPTAAATTATITATGNVSTTISGDGYIYGISFINGTSTSTGFIACTPTGTQIYESCNFSIPITGATAYIYPGNAGTGGFVKWINCNVKFGAVGQGMNHGCSFHWQGGGVTAGGTTPTTLFVGYAGGGGLGGTIITEDVDFSNLASTMHLTIPPTSLHYKVSFRNCKLPASWSGNLVNGAFPSQGRVSMYNCDSGATNYRLWIEDYLGTIRDETTLVRTGGASDGVTPLSWKMSANTKEIFPEYLLASDEFVAYNSAVGSSKTVTVEILRDSATNLTDKEVWLEVNYLSASGTPLGALITDRAANLVVAAADQTASSATWTTTGMSNPNKQKLEVTFTPQMKGYIHCRVMLAKVSTTLYVDLKITIA